MPPIYADESPGRKLKFPKQAFRDFLERHHIPLELFADRLGFSIPHVRRLWNGSTLKTKHSTLLKIAQIVNELAQIRKAEVPEEFQIIAAPQAISIPRSPMNFMEASRLMAGFMANSATPKTYWIAAYHLNNAYRTIEGLGERKSHIQQVRIRAMTAKTIARLEPFLPDRFAKDFERNLEKIRELFSDRPADVKIEYWKRLPQFHGSMFGEHMTWGGWKVDRRGRLTIDDSENFYVSGVDGDTFEFGRLKTLFQHGDTMEEEWK